MKTIIIAVVFFVIFLSTIITPVSNPTSGSLKVSVVNGSGVPQSNATIDIYNLETDLLEVQGITPEATVQITYGQKKIVANGISTPETGCLIYNHQSSSANVTVHYGTSCP